MNKYHTENYENSSKGQSNHNPNPNPNSSFLNKGMSVQRPSHTLFCNDEIVLNPNDTNYIYPNQRLAGPANPKTLIAPVIAPPITDLDYWRANNLINHSHINSESQYDTYLSGYEVSNCCDRKEPLGDIIEDYEGVTDINCPIKSKYNPLSTVKGGITSPYPKTTEAFFSTAIRDKKSLEGYEGFSSNEKSNVHQLFSNKYLEHTEIVSPTPVTSNSFPYLENYEYPKDIISNNESGWVNTTCGYNPHQIEQYNLPSNLATGNCEREYGMKQYNKNLFTQTIQPDVYTNNEIIEPINSNMGISFTQQFEPKTSVRDEYDVLTYTEHDPRVYKPKMMPNTPDMSVTESDIYDPRFNGYGTSYRAYTDENIGQTRFYYDDINSVRMPNYIVRSNIDFANYADSYGPLNDGNKHGNKYNNNIRELAQDTFLNSSLQQRDDLMERLMRKRNSELWQLRKYPKHTMSK
jgi:hypothetical protein